MIQKKADRMIRLRYATKEQLDGFGNKNDTYDIIVNDLINAFKRRKNIRNYYHMMQRALKKYWVCCQHCKKNKATEVHHISRDRKDNSLENMYVCCKGCHIEVHKKFVYKKELPQIKLMGQYVKK